LTPIGAADNAEAEASALFAPFLVDLVAMSVAMLPVPGGMTAAKLAAASFATRRFGHESA